MVDESNIDPWKGAAGDKLRHPRLGRFVDNIWILSMNRLVGSVAPMAIVALLGWTGTKIGAFNDVTREFPSLVSDVREIARQVKDESTTQARMIDKIKETQQDVASLRAEVSKDQKAIADTNSDAAAARARVDDMRDDLRRIETLASQNLAVSQSHDADIKATRHAVDPSSPQ